MLDPTTPQAFYILGGYYEYIDLDNDKGKARYCSYKFEHIKAGGQGSPVCELYDGTIIQVKQYKYIKELKGIDKEWI